LTTLPTKKVAIVQSNYIPWKGYFDLINIVDEFILFDEMQYTRRDWRNRNIIKTAAGLKWLTIPVAVKGNFFQKIKDTTVSDSRWARKHWETIVHNYSKAKHFSLYREVFAELYASCAQEKFLSRINYLFLSAICKILNIDTAISSSEDYVSSDGKTERLVSLCKQAGATTYISGPAARDYLDEALFDRENIALQYMDYSSYPEYGQLSPPFEHRVSIIDLIFNEGPEATNYMKSFSR
jgi:WbqC-like protein family